MIRDARHKESSLHANGLALLAFALIVTLPLAIFRHPASASGSPVVITLSSYSLSAGQTATVTFTFPVAPVSFTSSDVTASNGTISGLAATSNPDIYTATFTPTASIDAPTNTISVSSNASFVTYAGTGTYPSGIAFDGTNMWTVDNAVSNSVSKVTPTGTITTYSGAGRGSYGIAFDGTNMWTANTGDDSVSEITPTGTFTTYTDTGIQPTALAFDGTSMWTANTSDDSVSKITPSSVLIGYAAITTYMGTGSHPSSIAFDGTNMWTANTSDDSVTKITPTGTMTTYTGTGDSPDAIAFDGTNMWTANAGDDSVTKITPTGTMTTYTGTGDSPDAIAFDGTNMWTANGGDNSVSEITPTGTITTYTGTGTQPDAIAFDGTNMWTANAGDDSVTKVLPIESATSANYAIDTVVSSGATAGTTGGSGGGRGSNGGTVFPPTLSEAVPVATPSQNPAPSYTFDSTESGTLAYGGSCASDSVYAVNGANAITFLPMLNGIHADCTIQETDLAGRKSNVLDVTSFTIDTPQIVLPTATTTPVKIVIPAKPTPPVQKVKPTPPPLVATSTPTVTPTAVSSTPIVEPVFPVIATTTSIEIPIPVPVAAVVATTTPVAVVACPESSATSALGMIVGEIEWQLCTARPTLAADIERASAAYEAEDGDIIMKIVATIAVLSAALTAFMSGLFLDALDVSEIGLEPGRLGALLLAGLGVKKRSPWGVVYDSVTKAPLDPVRLELRASDGRVVARTTTAIDGTFGFALPAPGTYSVVAKKKHYAFPSQRFLGAPHDEVYRHLYHGEPFIVAKDVVPVLNMPLDPQRFDWETFAKNSGPAMRADAKTERTISFFVNGLFPLGFLAATVAIVMDHDQYNATLFVLALAVFLIKRKSLYGHAFGYVREAKTGLPLSFSIVRIVSIVSGKPITDVVLDAIGRYSYPIRDGAYAVRIDRKLPDGTYHTVASDVPATAKHGFLAQDFIVPPQS